MRKVKLLFFLIMASAIAFVIYRASIVNMERSEFKRVCETDKGGVLIKVGRGDSPVCFNRDSVIDDYDD